MDKKQKIYVVIIVLCMVVSGGVLYWGYGGSSASVPTLTVELNNNGAPTLDTPTTISPNVSNIPSATTQNEYAAPTVFPDNSTLDLTVFESSQFAQLKDYTPLTVQPEEIGRENPFIGY